jgi:hypothetical protein
MLIAKKAAMNDIGSCERYQTTRVLWCDSEKAVLTKMIVTIVKIRTA